MITHKKIDSTIAFLRSHFIWFLLLLLVPVFIYFKNIISYLNTQVPNMHSKPYKVVVFDLDETLGCFIEVSIFWNALEYFYGHNLFNDKFFEVMDTFPEFFRPNIFNMLDFIHRKKLNKVCNKIIIYTNNQGTKGWVKMISDYFDNKLGYKVFDNIIVAYKVNGRQIEPKRTSHEKSVADLISCTGIPADSEICFVDDLYHHLMDKNNVFYIHIKPYYYSMPFNEMAARYYDMVLNKSQQATVSKDVFVNTIDAYTKEYNYQVNQKNVLETKTDIIVSKKLLSHLEEFLKPSRLPNTRKKRSRRKKTLRRL